MSESLQQWLAELDAIAARLASTEAAVPNAAADHPDQVAAERAIAQVLAAMSGRSASGEAIEAARPIAARDLLITVNLVRKNAKTGAIITSQVMDAPDCS